MRFQKCEFCEKCNFRNVNFKKNEISERWILRKMRFQKGEFCKNWNFLYVNFWMKCGFLLQCDFGTKLTCPILKQNSCKIRQSKNRSKVEMDRQSCTKIFLKKSWELGWDSVRVLISLSASTDDFKSRFSERFLARDEMDDAKLIIDQ